QNALRPAGEIFVGGGPESSGDVAGWVSEAELEQAQEQLSLTFLAALLAAFLVSLLGTFPGEFLSSSHVGLLSNGSNRLGKLMDVVGVSIGGDGNILQEQAQRIPPVGRASDLRENIDPTVKLGKQVGGLEGFLEHDHAGEHHEGQ